jgi:uncharacterized protein YndB with AHSA1/START domain
MGLQPLGCIFMADALVDVVREIELDASAEEVWRAVTEPAELAAWLGDEVELDVRPGGRGRVVDDGVARVVEVDDVQPGHHVSFRWWVDGEGEAGASQVVITILPSGGPTRLVVRETLSGPRARATARASDLRWDVRLVCLAVLVASLVTV